MRKFSKVGLYEYARQKGVQGSWQDVWSSVGGVFVSVHNWGISIMKFPVKDSVYLKFGDTFYLFGRLEGEREIRIDYDEEVFGRGAFVGYVELPVLMEIVEVEGEKGVVGTIWRKTKIDNGRLGKEGFIPYKVWERWEGKKVKFGIELREYRRFEVWGRDWEKMFEAWEEKRKRIREEFYFRKGLPLAEKYPPRRVLSVEEWREYCILLGEHFHWLERIREEREDRELRRLVWGEEYDNNNNEEWEDGFSIVTTDFSTIRGPISIFGLFRFLAGDLRGALERRPSRYSIPVPAL